MFELLLWVSKVSFPKDKTTTMVSLQPKLINRLYLYPLPITHVQALNRTGWTNAFLLHVLQTEKHVHPSILPLSRPILLLFRTRVPLLSQSGVTPTLTLGTRMMQTIRQGDFGQDYGTFARNTT